ncbi:MAG: rhodanese-like domain-containing protein [Rickettsiaceae bacterium]|nr:rhodanese-like domain-containing protein [Rickettsiaceae bacterium]
MINKLTSIELFDMLSKLSDYFIIDTRTEREWSEVGYPDVKDRVLLISSHLPPDMVPNTEFLNELKNKAANIDSNLFFICKTSGRSSIAAAAAESFGYKNCFVISDGFEGSNFGPGWKNNNLPFCYKK